MFDPSKPHDESGFWVVDHFKPGRGGSSVTYAHHSFGEVWLNQRFYQPGPFDFYNPKLPQLAKSTYSVWSGFALDIDDGDIDSWSTEQLAQAAGPIPACSTLEVWSPDGEGAIYVVFQDEDIEEAIKYAKSRNHKENNGQ